MFLFDSIRFDFLDSDSDSDSGSYFNSDVSVAANASNHTIANGLWHISQFVNGCILTCRLVVDLPGDW